MLKLIESELSERMIRSHMSTQTISRLSGIPEDQIGKIAAQVHDPKIPAKTYNDLSNFLDKLGDSRQ